VLNICGNDGAKDAVGGRTIGKYGGSDCRRTHYVQRSVSTAAPSVRLVRRARKCAYLSARYPVNNRPTKEPALAIDMSVYASLADMP